MSLGKGTETQNIVFLYDDQPMSYLEMSTISFYLLLKVSGFSNTYYNNHYLGQFTELQIIILQDLEMSSQLTHSNVPCSSISVILIWGFRYLQLKSDTLRRLDAEHILGDTVTLTSVKHPLQTWLLKICQVD